jgi:hypothetical protein
VELHSSDRRHAQDGGLRNEVRNKKEWPSHRVKSECAGLFSLSYMWSPSRWSRRNRSFRARVVLGPKQRREYLEGPLKHSLVAAGTRVVAGVAEPFE